MRIKIKKKDHSDKIVLWLRINKQLHNELKTLARKNKIKLYELVDQILTQTVKYVDK